LTTFSALALVLTIRFNFI